MYSFHLSCGYNARVTGHGTWLENLPTVCHEMLYTNSILGDPGQSVGSGERARRKFSSTGERAPGYRLSPNYFQKFKRMSAPDWAQKMLCIIVPNRLTVSPEFFSWVRTRRLLFQSWLVWLCTQSGNFQFDIKSPSNFKILFARKLKTLFQKYKLELTTGIHACIGHVLRKY